jgi:hypothetical protein
MPRITVSRESYDRILHTKGASQTVGESLAELLAQRERFDDALYDIALALPPSAPGFAFSDTAIPGYTNETLIRYIMERAREVVFPGQPVAGIASPTTTGQLHDGDRPATVATTGRGPSVWSRLRHPEL